ncbi:branched-subunit amino acid permease [Cytobacillus purgationiresistens]|uniref:Branched-chain amino acid transport system carrier protein n=1 Tax=Cytobacillus purgationiresistens TaxID=863449 RepID=A0ABU0AD12_9BACI|nr:branched-chain amino acid transport system II carrier protein [Cytobacillus purgationiresistens]MDQ0269144.1 branched-subunit amino acid permease [Cytobacillus purgationiresistens]
MIGVGIVAILDALKDAGIGTESLNNALGFIPLFENGAGWIATGILGFIVSLIIAKSRKEPGSIINMAGQEIKNV